MQHRVRGGLRIEEVGDDVVVLDASGGIVHAVSGRAAIALRHVAEGTTVPATLADALHELEAKRIVAPLAGGWSRRRALLVGGVGAAVAAGGLLSMELPAAAEASSCTNAGGLGDIPVTPRTFNSSATFKTGTMVTMLALEVWGGGGGAGTAVNAAGGGGGGGGGFVRATITVTPCTEYPIVVGAGGDVDMDGGTSSFGGTLAVAPGGSMGGSGFFATGGAGGAAGTTTGTLNFANMGGAGAASSGGGLGMGNGGGGGGSGGTSGPGMDATAQFGGAGSAGGGDGGDGGATGGLNGAGGAGTAGDTPGGGGGGGGAGGGGAGASAAGALGRVVVSEAIA